MWFFFRSGIPIIMVATITALHQYTKKQQQQLQSTFFFSLVGGFLCVCKSIHTFEWFFNLLNGLFYCRNKENKNHLIGEKRL